MGGRRRRPPTVVEAAEGRLHNGGWGDEWLEKVDKTLLKYVAIASKAFHQLYPAIYYFLEEISTVLVLEGGEGGPPPRPVGFNSPRRGVSDPQDGDLAKKNKKTEFICEFCDKCYSTNGNLSRHLSNCKNKELKIN